MSSYRVYLLEKPLYDITCVGLSLVGRELLYYNDFTSITSDWAMINGTNSPRGLIGMTGYWSLVQGYSGGGLRGFPINWQLREQKTYQDYNPDVRFIPQSTNALRIDSYIAGTNPIGNGYLFAVLPVDLVNNTIMRNRFNAYFPFSGQRTVGVIDIVNRPINRSDDTLFATYNSAAPPWEYYKYTYYRIYTVNVAGGVKSFDIVNTTSLPGYGPYVTFSYVLEDYWILQSVYIDVFYILLNETSTQTIYNFTFPYNSYTVVMERSGTYGDYGYLDFGFPGFTAVYTRSLKLTDYPALSFSVRVKPLSGVGEGGFILVDSSLRNYYFIALNTTGYLNIYKNSGSKWVSLASAPLSSFTVGAWYNLYVVLDTSSGVNIVNAYLYDDSWNLLANVQASDSSFTPYYAGLGSYSSTLVYVDFVFDDFTVAAIQVRKVPLNYSVELYDSTNTLVASGTSSTGTVYLAPRGAPLLNGGVFLVRYPNTQPCLNTSVDTQIEVGDIYYLTWNYASIDTTARLVQAYVGYGSNTTFFSAINITINTATPIPAYLTLSLGESTIPPALNAEIYLVNSTNHLSTPIAVSGGSILSHSTSTISLSGSGNYIWVKAWFSQSGSRASLAIDIIFCMNSDCTVTLRERVTLVLQSPS